MLFRKYSGIDFRHGLPDFTDFDGSEPVLLIIDDLMNEMDESVANIFTRVSNHRNATGCIRKTYALLILTVKTK